MTTPSLHIFPSSSCIDEKLSISVTGLQPGQEIAIRADMGEWSSEALFKADRAGMVLLHRDAPLSGSYETIDPMGLFWSMRHPTFAGACRTPNPKIEFQLWVDGNLKKSLPIERHSLRGDINRTEIREKGLVGTLFTPPASRASSAIIVLGGSSGGLAEGRAAMLANRGFSALALAYFAYPGLSEQLEEIPLEYFETAIDFLKENHETVGLYGISRGAEAALLTATHFPDKVDAVAGVVPSSIVLAGFPNRSKSAWTLQNIPLDFSPFEERKWGSDEGQNPKEAIRLTPLFLQSMSKPGYKEAPIPVEKIRCPVLLISGTDDQMWPSHRFAADAASRISAPCTHICYENAGHHISYPYQPVCTVDFHPTAKAWFDFGGTKEANAVANEDSWNQLIQFFSEILT
jgi:dienelactone hydrolase